MPSRRNAKKITIVTHEASLTGAPLMILNLAEGLQKYYNIQVISLRDGPALELFRWDNQPIIIPERDHMMGLIRYLDLLDLGRQLYNVLKPDLILVNCIVSHVFFHAALDSQIPVIYYSHDGPSSYQRLVKYGGIPFKDFGMHLENAIDKGIVSSSKILYYHVTDRHVFRDHMGVTAPVKLVLPIVNFQKVITGSREELPEDTAGFFQTNNLKIGMIGQPTQRKGYDLFQAMAQTFANANANANFYWIGQAVTKQMGNLFLIKQTDNPYCYLKALDYLVLSSREDKCPLVVVEALYLGIKPIFFDDNLIGDSPDIFEKLGGNRIHGNVEKCLTDTVRKITMVGRQYGGFCHPVPPEEIEKIFSRNSIIQLIKPDIEELLSSASKGDADVVDGSEQAGEVRDQALDKVLDKALDTYQKLGTPYQPFDRDIYLDKYRDLAIAMKNRRSKSVRNHFRIVGYKTRNCSHPDWKLFLALNDQYFKQFIDSPQKLDRLGIDYTSLKLEFDPKKYVELYPDLLDRGPITDEQATKHWLSVGWLDRCCYQI